MTNLKRFEDAHRSHFHKALYEIKNGRKTSHWMWFIFPQIKGIGFSDTSKYYAIRDLDEAKDFLRHPILGHNFVSICSELLKLQTNNPTEVFGKPDDQKLFSSMTLFSLAAEETSTFHKVLDKYFNGEKDQKTIALLNSE